MAHPLVTSHTTTNTFQRVPIDLTSARVPVGEVSVIPQRCKGCGYCIAFCPEQVLAFSAKINPKGYHYPEVTEGKESACVHCGFCTLVCPDMAIFTEEVVRHE